MAPADPLTPFLRALVASGLAPPSVTGPLIERLAPLPPEDRDRQASARLIESGLLNHWQVEQLRAGRTKFTLGPYTMVDSLGRGGMGHVFQGRHELLGRIEAIKVLPRARMSPEAIAAFRHEARVQAQLDHPNLVRLTYADRDGDTYFLVTEFVPGVDLRRLVRRCGPLPHPLAAYVALQAAEGLDYAHRKGLVHRDVKPGNLLLAPDGRVKLTDLGLAWFLGADGDGVPGGKKAIVGTCDYLAPECIQHPERVLPVSDLYALGCTLYYAVTGKVPFPGGGASDKLRRAVSEEPLDPLALAPQLPAGFVALLRRLMHKDVTLRPPTAGHAAEALRPFVSAGAAAELGEAVAECERRTRRRAQPAAAGDVGETVVDQHPLTPVPRFGEASHAGDEPPADPSSSGALASAPSHETVSPHSTPEAPHGGPHGNAHGPNLSRTPAGSGYDALFHGVFWLALTASLAIVLLAVFYNLLLNR